MCDVNDTQTPVVEPSADLDLLVVTAARAALVAGLHAAVERWADSLITEVLLAQALALPALERVGTLAL